MNNLKKLITTSKEGVSKIALIVDKLTDPFFVINADLLTNLNFNYMLQYHFTQVAGATMGTCQAEALKN